MADMLNMTFKLPPLNQGRLNRCADLWKEDQLQPTKEDYAKIADELYNYQSPGAEVLRKKMYGYYLAAGCATTTQDSRKQREHFFIEAERYFILGEHDEKLKQEKALELRQQSRAS